MAASAAMELKVLISILQSGAGLQSILSQVNQISTALTNLQNQVNKGSGPTSGIGQGVQKTTEDVNRLNAQFDTLSSLATQAGRALKFLAGGFLALQSVQFLKKLADEAANVEVLTTVLHVVAQNAAYTTEQIDEVDKSVQKLGITAASSKQALTSFLQARLPLSYAKDLARAAQDLAVISGMNSSDTFKRLIVNIQQLDALGLRWMGIVVDRAAAEDKFRLKQVDTTKALNKRQQQEALMQEVLEKARLLEGAYANAMGDVQKQIASLDRLTDTYRATLGESLLPAYSNIVRVVTTTLDKIILLSQAFSANRARAQEWAEAATGIATAGSKILLFLAHHIEQLVVLARLYLEWRVSILWINAVATGFSWIGRVIVLINNMRYAWVALRASMIGYQVALEAVGASSTKEAIKIIAVAAANARLAAAQAAVGATAPGAAAGIAAVGTAATVATAGISTLALAWGSILAVLAIPVVGYIYYKIKAEHEEEAQKPVMQRGAEAAEAFGGQATVEGIRAILASGRAGGALQEVYTEWRKQIDATGKSEEQLREQFIKSVAEYRKTSPLIANQSVLDDYVAKIGEAQEEVTRLTTESEQLRAKQRAATDPVDKRAVGIERTLVDRQLEDRRKKLSDLQKEMIKAAETRVQGSSEADAEAQIDKYDASQVRYDKIRDTGSRKAVAYAQAEMAAEKAILEEMKKRFELRLKTEQLTDAERKQDEKALASIKGRLTETADQAERIRTSTETLFGSKYQFTPEGDVLGGQFAKEVGAFESLVDDAKTFLEEEGSVPEQIAEKIKKGITALGQAAQQPADLTRLKKTLAEAQALMIPETGRLGREATILAQIGVRQARLTIRAPIVQETKDQIHRQTDPIIEEAKQRLESLKNEGEQYLLLQKTQYDKGLIGLQEYHDATQKIMVEEGSQELDLLALQIQQQDRLTTAEEDPKAKAAAELQGLQLRGQYEARMRKLALDYAKDINEEDETRRKLTEQVKKDAFDFAAQYGGEKEALDALNYSLELEVRLQRASNIVGYDRLILLKQEAGIQEANRKERQRNFDLSLLEFEARKRELDLAQQRRSVERAKDQADVAQGRMTAEESRLRENVRIGQEQADNLVRQQRETEKLFRLQKNASIEIKKAYIDRYGVVEGTPEHKAAEATKAQAEEQEKQSKIIAEQQGVVVGLQEAYESLAGSIQLHSVTLKKQFEEGFASALTQTITDFHKAGEAWKSAMTSITTDIVNIFVTAFTQRLFKKLGLFNFVDALMNRIFGGGGSRITQVGLGDAVGGGGLFHAAEGGMINGPGTGTSDSVPIWASAGEHIMPAAKTAQFLPLLEGIRSGKILPFAKGGMVQSIALPSLIPRRYAAGGVVVSDGGAGAVQTGGGPSNMVVTMHPDTLNMTMREWLEHEVVRQQGRR